jgi:hypothetical protein
MKYRLSTIVRLSTFLCGRCCVDVKNEAKDLIFKTISSTKYASAKTTTPSIGYVSEKRKCILIMYHATTRQMDFTWNSFTYTIGFTSWQLQADSPSAQKNGDRSNKEHQHV